MTKAEGIPPPEPSPEEASLLDKAKGLFGVASDKYKDLADKNKQEAFTQTFVPPTLQPSQHGYTAVDPKAQAEPFTELNPLGHIGDVTQANQYLPETISGKMRSYLPGGGSKTPPQPAAGIAPADDMTDFYRDASTGGLVRAGKDKSEGTMNLVYNSVGWNMQNMYKGAPAAYVANAARYTTNLLSSEPGQVLASAWLNGDAVLDDANNRSKLFSDARFSQAIDANIDAFLSVPQAAPQVGSDGKPVQQQPSQPFNLDAMFGKISPKYRKVAMDAYLDNKAAYMASLDQQIGLMQKYKNTAEVKRLEGMKSAETSRLSQMMSRTTGWDVKPEVVGSFLSQPSKNREMLHGIAANVMTGKSPTAAAWETISANPVDAIKSFATDSGSRSLLWNYASGWAKENPMTAILIGGVALIGMLSVASMAMNMVGGVFGGGSDDED